MGALLSRSKRAHRLGSQPGQPSAKPPDTAQPSPAASPAAPIFRCPAPPQAYADFATGLIAAKSVKPCDGVVFGAFYSLLKKERSVASRTLVWLRMGFLRLKRGIAWAHLLRCIAWALQTGASFGQLIGPNRQSPSRPTRRSQAPPQARPRPAFAAAHDPKAFADFATGLIAAKPEKPCDGAVFGAFYSLLKKERNAANRMLVWLRMGLLRPKRAHRLGASLGRIA